MSDPRPDPDTEPPFGPIQTWLRFALGFFIVAVTSAVYFVLCVLLIPFRATRVRLGNVASWIMGRGACWAVGTRLRFVNKEGLDPRRPAIYVANHTSGLDTFISIGIAPLGTAGIVKKEVRRVPVFGQAYWLSGHLMIQRADRAGAIAAMDDLSAFVRRKGIGIWMMPEGTRSVDGRLARFKKGLVHLAIATRLPVVPVLFHGVHRRWPHTKPLTLTPGEVVVEVTEPIPTDDWTAETLEDHLAAVRQVFLERLKPDQRPLEEAAA